MPPSSKAKSSKQTTSDAPDVEKYKFLKRKLKALLEENDKIGDKLKSAKTKISQLKKEKDMLLDRLAMYEGDSSSDSDSIFGSDGSDSDSDSDSANEQTPRKNETASPSKGDAPSALNHNHTSSHTSSHTSHSQPDQTMSQSEQPSADQLSQSPAMRDDDDDPSISQQPSKKPRISQKPTSSPNGAAAPDTPVSTTTATMISPSIPTPENTRRPKKTTQKRAPVTTKLRKIQEIPVGEDGQPVLPMQIGIMTLHSLGAVVTDRENFHSERYIYPVGYCVSRQYASMIDPERSVIYTSRVLDGGDGPRFHVVAEDMPDKPIVANSATGAWTTIIKNANQLRNREHSNSASGPDYFGFSQPSIAKMIQDLPGADLCKSYVHQEFEVSKGRGGRRSKKDSEAAKNDNSATGTPVATPPALPSDAFLHSDIGGVPPSSELEYSVADDVDSLTHSGAMDLDEHQTPIHSSATSSHAPARYQDDDDDDSDIFPDDDDDDLMDTPRHFPDMTRPTAQPTLPPLPPQPQTQTQTQTRILPPADKSHMPISTATGPMQQTNGSGSAGEMPFVRPATAGTFPVANPAS